MKGTLSLSLICLLLTHYAFSQIVINEPLSSRQTYYRIDARLDPDEKTVTAKMEAYWVNKSSDIVPDIRLHLYMNAFKTSRTTFNKGVSMNSADNKIDFGWIDLTSFEDGQGNDLTGRMTFISPDDNNPDDQTVIKIITERFLNLKNRKTLY